jgi:hypothetical protein
MATVSQGGAAMTALPKLPPLGLSRDQWHRYVAHYPPALPTEPLVGVTSVLKLQDVLIGGDLAAWGGRIAGGYVLEHFAELRDSVDVVGDSLKAVSAARDIGSEVHAQIEQILRKQPTLPTERTAPYIYAFSSFLAAERPEFLLVEAMVANLTHSFAGTFDFAARMGGKLVLVDVKSGRLKLSHRLQLAGYAAGEFVGVEGSTRRKRIPKFDAYYVLLLTPDGYELVEQDVTEADREHFLFLVDAYHQIRAWEKE